jgi:hypothetical protein
MRDSLNDAWQELKRADHLIYVSLKYTRTVDVIKHIIQRFINSFDFLFDAILKKNIEDGKISEIPVQPIRKCLEVKKLYPEDEEVIKGCNYYLYLKKLDKAEFTRTQEFRRHVTMTALIEGEEVIANIDTTTADYQMLKELFNYIQNNHLL